MEKNLPLVSLSITDKAYNRLVIPFLEKLDNGNFFKNTITLLLSVSAVGLLLGGIYLSIDGLIGEFGFVELYILRESLSDAKRAGAAAGLLPGFALSIIAAWASFSVLKKRTEQIKTVEYDGLVSFVYVKLTPKLILVVGELCFVLVLYTGILQIIATLVGSYVYAPLAAYPKELLRIVPGMDLFSGLAPRQIQGSYDNFGVSFLAGLVDVVASFFLLISFYLYKEVYDYILKLATNLLAFLPKFAIPLAIKKREEN